MGCRGVEEAVCSRGGRGGGGGRETRWWEREHTALVLSVVSGHFSHRSSSADSTSQHTRARSICSTKHECAHIRVLLTHGHTLCLTHSLTHVKHGATRSTAQCARKHLRARSTLALQRRLSCVRPQGLLSLVLRSSSCLSCYIHVTACGLPLSFSGDVSLVFRKVVSTRALPRARDRVPTRRTRACEPLVSGARGTMSASPRSTGILVYLGVSFRYFLLYSVQMLGSTMDTRLRQLTFLSFLLTRLVLSCQVCLPTWAALCLGQCAA